MNRTCKIPHTNIIIWVFVVHMCIGVFTTCSSTDILVRSEEEIAFAQEAIREMGKRLIGESVQQISIDNSAQWDNALLIPERSLFLIKESSKVVPGIDRLLQRFNASTMTYIFQVLEDLSIYAYGLIETIHIADPFSVIEQGPTEVTDLFFTQYTEMVSQWISEQVSTPHGEEMNRSWEALLDRYAIYAHSQNLIERGRVPIVAEHESSLPIKTITESIITHLRQNMSGQEQLLRALAPSFDDPYLTLFAYQEK